jgi:hypothetical protein
VFLRELCSVDLVLRSLPPTSEMAGGFKFQKGPVFLSDNEAHVDSVDANAKLSKFDVFTTTILHFLSVYISTAGIGSSIWAYVVVRSYDQSRPPLYEDFMEDFVAIIFLVRVHSVSRHIFFSQSIISFQSR